MKKAIIIVMAILVGVLIVHAIVQAACDVCPFCGNYGQVIQRYQVGGGNFGPYYRPWICTYKCGNGHVWQCECR